VNVGGIITAKDIASTQQVTMIQKDGQGTLQALQILREHDREFAYIVDRRKRFLGIVSVDSLRAKPKRESIDVAFLKEIPIIDGMACLNDIVGIVASTPYSVPVVDENQKYMGAISKASLLRALDYQWEDEHE